MQLLDWWFVVCLLAAVVHAWPDPWPDPRRRAEGEPWPKPVHLERLGINKTIDQDLIIFSAFPCDIIQKAARRYRPRFVLTNATAGENSLRKIVVDLPDGADCPSVVPESMDESYSIQSTSPHSTIHISAKEVWGALRGLETLSQLVIVDGRSILPIVKIHDEPRFPYRGVLLDTSRHFLSVNILKSTLDLMSQNKFNVFHWHIVDSPSFPYKSNVYPQLAKGAFSPKHVYTIKQVTDIIAYARRRGIRVIPEFDTPGHMGGWGIGMPELLTRCYDKEGQEVFVREMVDLMKNTTWSILRAFFTEAFEVFPDSFFHLGGDETEFWAETCWENNRDIQHFMKLHNLKNVTELQQWYFTKLLEMLNGIKNKKKFVAWQDVFDYRIKLPGAIAHVWKADDYGEVNPMEEMDKVTAAGHHAILSSCWYLDRIKDKPDWKDYYKCDPHGFNGTAAQKRLVLGGEAALWGEWVDETNLISRLFPRASAVAERLWSAANTTKNPEKEYPRLYGWACKMVSRGYPVQPLEGPSYCPHEYHANLPF